MTMNCTDVFGNAGGDYIDCISGFFGVNGNISEDPQFCNAPAGDFTLAATSPCAPSNAPPGCELIGAFDVACGQLAIDEQAMSPQQPVISIFPNPVRLEAQVIVRGMRPGDVVEIVNAAGRIIHAISQAEAG